MFNAVAQAFYALFAGVYEVAEYVVVQLFNAIFWCIEQIYYFMLSVVFGVLETLVGGLDWLPEIIWNDNVILALEVCNNFAPVYEASLCVPAIAAFEGALLVFKVSRWLIWA